MLNRLTNPNKTLSFISFHIQTNNLIVLYEQALLLPDNVQIIPLLHVAGRNEILGLDEVTAGTWTSLS